MTCADYIKKWEKELHRLKLQHDGVERKMASLRAKIEAGKEILAQHAGTPCQTTMK